MVGRAILIPAVGRAWELTRVFRAQVTDCVLLHGRGQAIVQMEEASPAPTSHLSATCADA